MTDETRQSVGTDDYSPAGGNHKKGIKIFLIASAGVLVAALAVSAVLLMGNTVVSESRIERIMEYGTVINGVSVGGIDISGMTAEEARSATADLESSLLDEIEFTIDLDGDMLKFDAASFGLFTDYETVIAQAADFGHTGSFDERKQAADTAGNGGMNFDVKVSVDKAGVDTALTALSATFNVEARDASYVFMPNGYFADGTPFDPAAYDTETQGEPQLVRLTAAEMPNPLRYQYWQNKKYIDNYIPKDASIARFLYTSEQKGLKTDLGALGGMIVSAVENGDYSTITAPTEATEPTVTLEQVKAVTQLVSSWTSSYSNHAKPSRDYNVAKLSGIINGVVFEPGVDWSINEEAGPRTNANGWKDAAGISGGAFVQDPGGGVCQISSTVYNAALRSAMTIVSSKRHSIISDYIPIGLDATISTGSPDLVLQNPNATPMFMVSYMNTDEQNVTVEIYGTPVVNATHGDVILHFTSEKTGTGAAPAAVYYYNMTQTPDGTAVPVGGSREYVQGRGSTTANVFIHYLKPEDGTEIASELFYKATYRAYGAQWYVNGPDPSIPVPTPVPVEPTLPPVDPAPTPSDPVPAV